MDGPMVFFLDVVQFVSTAPGPTDVSPVSVSFRGGANASTRSALARWGCVWA